MAAATAAPITIIRHMHLKPSASYSDPEFTGLWKEVFAWLKSKSVEPQLWQNLSIPNSLVLISGWPSHDFRSESFDSAKEKEFGEKLGKFLDSKNYQELKLDMHSIPLHAPILSIESFNVAAHDVEVFERKAIEAQTHVSEKTMAIAAVGGWDVFEEMQQQQQPTKATTATTTATETATGTADATQVEGEKLNLTGDVIESLGEAGKGAAPVTDKGVTGAVQPGDSKSTAKKLPDEAASATGSAGLPKFRTWVSITGWNDEEQHVESAKEVVGNLEAPREKVEATKNIYETVHLKKLMA